MTLHQLFPCTNFGCDRLTTATLCCAPCEQADADGYGIPEDGPLGHTETCDRLHRERGASTEHQRVMHRAARGHGRPAT